MITSDKDLLRTSAIISLSGALLYALLLLRTAWVGDDAYISFRVVDNFINGYGLTWNPVERVQAFTNPLWTLILTAVYFFTREIYLSSLGVSIFVSLAVYWVVVHLIARQTWTRLTVILCLLLSPGFIDFSTSGLESCLTHLILVLFYAIYFKAIGQDSRHRFLMMSLLAGLGLFNRLDQCFLFVVPIAHEALTQTAKSRLRTVGSLLLGLSPIILWEIFAIIYYGFPFPNTAYAKMALDIPVIYLIKQGGIYLLDSLVYDPLLLFVIGLSAIFFFSKREGKHFMALIAVVGQILYVVKVGGDFMSGRFLTSGFIVAVSSIATLNQNVVLQKYWQWVCVCVVALGLSVPVPTLLSGRDYSQKIAAQGPLLPENGIANERAFYFGQTGLTNQIREKEMPRHDWLLKHLPFRSASQRQVLTPMVVGMAGFGVGPKHYILDEFALGDPLLARLPLTTYELWRIGHFARPLPYGYLDSRVKGRNLIQNPYLKEYYGYLMKITQGPIFAPQRWVHILKMNLGFYDHLLQKYVDGYQTVDFIDLQTPKEDGLLWDAPGHYILSRAGIMIKLDSSRRNHYFRLAADHNDEYLVSFYIGTRRLAELKVVYTKPNNEKNGIMTQMFEVPSAACQSGYDAIRIQPISRDERSSVAALILSD